MNSFIVTPAQQPLTGTITVPGDKSISHRALLFAALAQGDTEITGFLDSADCLNTLHALQALGVDIKQRSPQQLVVTGVGFNQLTQPEPIFLDMGNSGTGLRLIAGLVAGSPITVVLQGDDSLSKRPMKRIMDPLRQMGVDITSTSLSQATPPLMVKGTSNLKNIDYQLPIASAQIKSCLLLAGMQAEGETILTEPEASRNHSELLLQYLEYPIAIDGLTIRIQGRKPFNAKPIAIPADISSAAFFIVAATIIPGSHIVIKNVGVNPTRTGLIDVLQEMGASIRLTNPRYFGVEPVADIEVHASQLHGIDVPATIANRMMDEFPILFVAAAAAVGETKISGLAELRVKESDRLQVMSDQLFQLGVENIILPDNEFYITGKGVENYSKSVPFHGGKVTTGGDHRIAMSLAVAGLLCDSSLTIEDCANVATSFPNFIECAKTIGMNIIEKKG
jgi:3-phosphoshikimate 1-carboxyvinyltransferase